MKYEELQKMLIEARGLKALYISEYNRHSAFTQEKWMPLINQQEARIKEILHQMDTTFD